MCRYAYHEYRDHFACFRCPKMFRPHGYPGHHGALICPECGGPMHDMGLDFRPPKQQNVRQWRKVELLHAHGWTYHDCGCGGSGPAVRTLREARAFLAARGRRPPRCKAE